MNSIDVIKQYRKQVTDRLDRGWKSSGTRVMESTNLRYEVSHRTRATDVGGIGLMRSVADAVGVAEIVDRRVKLLKRHRPFHESDHILSLAYSMLCGEKTLDGLGARREDLAFLDAVSMRRIPHPTTAGDFLKRFDEKSIGSLLGAINECSAKVWRELDPSEKTRARIDIDGTIVGTTGNCREGTDFSYKGTFGYHPLIVSLANSGEILAVVNRPGNESSNANAAEWMDHGIDWARKAGFEKILLRGDTAFGLTTNFDRWHEAGAEFVLGMKGLGSFVSWAEAIDEDAWEPFVRTPGTPKKRARQAVVREERTVARGYKNLHLESEDLTEIEYQPKRSKGTYRMIILRKTIQVLQGQLRFDDEIRYLFYATNLSATEFDSAAVVREANARCNQENLIDQLKNGVGATRLPSTSFNGNWAHMLIGSLAWNLKAWLGLLLMTFDQPEGSELDSATGRHIIRMEFSTFVSLIIKVSTQILHQGRRLVFRILSLSRWTPFLVNAPPFFRRIRLT